MAEHRIEYRIELNIPIQGHIKMHLNLIEKEYRQTSKHVRQQSATKFQQIDMD